MNLWNEILRKGIHLSMLIIPVGYCFLSKATMLIILGITVLVALCVEGVRFRWKLFARCFNRFVGNLLRRSEQAGLTGATYLFAGAFLTILMFDKVIALIALLFLIISDALAALIGKLWGRHTLFMGKTLEGSVVFLVTALGIVLFLPTHPFAIGLTGVLTAFVIDVFIMKINDNIMIPIGSGLVMQLMTTFIN